MRRACWEYRIYTIDSEKEEEYMERGLRLVGECERKEMVEDWFKITQREEFKYKLTLTSITSIKDLHELVRLTVSRMSRNCVILKAVIPNVYTAKLSILDWVLWDEEQSDVSCSFSSWGKQVRTTSILHKQCSKDERGWVLWEFKHQRSNATYKAFWQLYGKQTFQFSRFNCGKRTIPSTI